MTDVGVLAEALILFYQRPPQWCCTRLGAAGGGCVFMLDHVGLLCTSHTDAVNHVARQCVSLRDENRELVKDFAARERRHRAEMRERERTLDAYHNSLAKLHREVRGRNPATDAELLGADLGPPMRQADDPLPDGYRREEDGCIQLAAVTVKPTKVPAPDPDRFVLGVTPALSAFPDFETRDKIHKVLDGDAVEGGGLLDRVAALVKERDAARASQARDSVATRQSHVPARCPMCDWTDSNLLNYGTPSKSRWLCHGCAAAVIQHADGRDSDFLQGAHRACDGADIPQGALDERVAALVKEVLTARDIEKTAHNMCDLASVSAGDLVQRVRVLLDARAVAPKPLPSSGRTHRLKSHPSAFTAVWSGDKVHEVRHNDRDYMVGDVLVMSEMDPSAARAYTGRVVHATVTSMTPGGSWGLPTGLCVMSVVVTKREGGK